MAAAEPNNPANGASGWAFPIWLKLALVMASVALFPLLIALTLSSKHTRTELERSQQESLGLVSLVTASRIDQLLIDHRHMAELMAMDRALIHACRVGNSPDRAAVLREATRVLNNIMASDPSLTQVMVLGVDGVGIASTLPTNIGQNLAFREYFQVAISGEPYVSEYVVGISTGTPGIYFTAPIYAELADGTRAESIKPIGVFVLKVNGERLWEIVGESSVPNGGYAILVNPDGVVTADSDCTKLYKSLRQLTRDEVTRINPHTTFGQPNIETLDIPELQIALDSLRTTTGPVRFAAPGVERGSFSEWLGAASLLRNKPWYVVVVTPQSNFARQIENVMRPQRLVALGVVGISMLLAITFGIWMVRPVIALTKAAKLLAKGDFTVRAPVNSNDEIGSLAAAFNAMVPQLQEKVQLQQSLAVAQEVQLALLPEKDPSPDGLDVSGHTKYCEVTGGDYYDFIEVARGSEEETIIAVGDVMGHGVAAALLMASARAALRAHAFDTGQLADLLSKVNRVLATDRNFRFMTLALAAINTRSGVMRWASAGHYPPIVYHASQDTFAEHDGGGVPLGIEQGVAYEEYAFNGIMTGDIIVLGSDGIWETQNPAGVQFGMPRLHEVIRLNRKQPASIVAKAIENALSSFRSSAAPEDDVTYVVVKVRGHLNELKQHDLTTALGIG